MTKVSCETNEPEIIPTRDDCNAGCLFRPIKHRRDNFSPELNIYYYICPRRDQKIIPGVGDFEANANILPARILEGRKGKHPSFVPNTVSSRRFGGLANTAGTFVTPMCEFPVLPFSEKMHVFHVTPKLTFDILPSCHPFERIALSSPRPSRNLDYLSRR